MNRIMEIEPAGARAILWTVHEGGVKSQLKSMSAGEFSQQLQYAERWLAKCGIGRDVAFLSGFGGNHVDDLVLRCAAINLGAVPVTINWQADSAEMVAMKAEIASVRHLVVHPSFTSFDLDELNALASELEVHHLKPFEQEGVIAESNQHESEDTGRDQVVIFTSGTTGRPKGVRLSRRAYEVNAAVFEQLLGLEDGEPLRLVLVNPLYHANSTAMADMGLRRPNTDIVLIPRYSGRYWHHLTEACRGFEGRVVAPAVSRHFEFLDNLLSTSQIEMTAELDQALRRTRFLVGSAPVGPETLERFMRLTGRPPQVRFGSTELCLQALGIPCDLSTQVITETFARGIQAAERPDGHAGYFIGRPHPPYTEARVVRSVQVGTPDFLKPTDEGELGYLVVRSDSVMTGYTGNPKATESALVDGWYLGLGDMAFWLESVDGAERDYFWVSRTAGLMIRGGSNYSCQQVEAELTQFVVREFGLEVSDFELAVVGVKLDSEHEDACCVLMTLLTEAGRACQSQLERDFLNLAREGVSKGARPDRVAFGAIARNFKGAVIRAEVRKTFCD